MKKWKVFSLGLVLVMSVFLLSPSSHAIMMVSGDFSNQVNSIGAFGYSFLGEISKVECTVGDKGPTAVYTFLVKEVISIPVEGMGYNGPKLETGASTPFVVKMLGCPGRPSYIKGLKALPLAGGGERIFFINGVSSIGLTYFSVAAPNNGMLNLEKSPEGTYVKLPRFNIKNVKEQLEKETNKDTEVFKNAERALRRIEARKATFTQREKALSQPAPASEAIPLGDAVAIIKALRNQDTAKYRNTAKYRKQLGAGGK